MLFDRSIATQCGRGNEEHRLIHFKQGKFQ